MTYYKIIKFLCFNNYLNNFKQLFTELEIKYLNLVF